MLEIFFSLNAKSNNQSGCLRLACIHKLIELIELNELIDNFEPMFPITEFSIKAGLQAQ